MKNGIDLIPGEVKKERMKKKARLIAAIAGALYLASLVLIMAAQRTGINERKEALAAIEARRDELLKGKARGDLGGRLAAAREAETELAARVNAMASVTVRKIAWSHVLKRLSAEVPEGVWLRSVSTSDADDAFKRVRLSGSATSNRPVAMFISGLENSGVFTGVSLTYTQKREQTEGAVYEFELYMDLKKTEETSHDW